MLWWNEMFEMNCFNTRLFVVIVIFLLAGCKSSPSLDGDSPVNFEDFGAVFPSLKLPFSVADSTLDEMADTTTISRSIFNRFVPDTLFKRYFEKDTAYKIRPIGKLEEKEKEDYLVVYAASKRKAAIYLLVFKNDSFSVAMPLLTRRKGDERYVATIDKKLSIIINKEWNKKDERMYERTVYAYNNVGVFTTVVIETNVPRVFTAATVLNPIDTFPQTRLYSGDYTKGRNNFISIRDGNSPNTYQFFVHFRSEGENPCGGDLRGEVTMQSPTTGLYTSDGDPCIIDFKFTKNTVAVKEQGSCGNYRGITCFFNETFTRTRKKSK